MNYSQLISDFESKAIQLEILANSIPPQVEPLLTRQPVEGTRSIDYDDDLIRIDNTVFYSSTERVRAAIGKFIEGVTVVGNKTHYRATHLDYTANTLNEPIYHAQGTKRSLYTAATWFAAYRVVLEEAFTNEGSRFN